MNAIDTNVLAYAVSSDEIVKAPQALALLERLTPADTVLLWQVACEFAGVLMKLQKQARTHTRGFDALRLYRKSFRLIYPTEAVLDRGLQIHEDNGVSYWDALLLAACVDAGVDRLYSEDIPGQPTVAGVQVINPFSMPA